MPIVDAGTGGGGGTSGKLWVRPKEIATKIIKAKDNRPAAVRVVFTVEGKEDTVSLAVPIGNPEQAAKMVGTLMEGDPPSGEADLRVWLAAGLNADKKMLANVSNNFIRAFIAPPGEYIGKLHRLRQHAKKDGTKRIWFTLQNREGLTTDFSAPWPMISCVKGNTPDTDSIGPEDQLNDGKGPFKYLCMFGLDWNRFKAELQAAPALWGGHIDIDAGPIKSYFANIDDLTPELFNATVEHGLKWVKWVVVDDPKWGPQIPRGDFFFNITPVEIIHEDGTVDPMEQEFQRELAVFNELWDNLIKAVYQNENLRFLAGGKPTTPHGDDLVKALIVPIVTENPGAVKITHSDGKPKLTFPIRSAKWRLNGLVLLDRFAEALFKLSPEEMFELVNISQPDTDKIVAWAKEHVPELADDLTVDKEEAY